MPFAADDAKASTEVWKSFQPPYHGCMMPNMQSIIVSMLFAGNTKDIDLAEFPNDSEDKVKSRWIMYQ
jgi:hypothetical protein